MANLETPAIDYEMIVVEMLTACIRTDKDVVIEVGKVYENRRMWHDVKAAIPILEKHFNPTPSEPQSVAGDGSARNNETKVCPKCGEDHSKRAYCGSRRKQMYSDPDKVDPPPSQDGESHEPIDGGEGAARYEESIQHRTKESYILCKHCDCPMLPPGVKKLPNEYDHAQGCPDEGKDASGNLIATASLDGGARQAEGSDEYAPAQIEALIQGHVNNEAISPDLLRGFANEVWQIATRYTFGKAAEMAENTSQLPKLAARLRQMQGKPQGDAGR